MIMIKPGNFSDEIIIILVFIASEKWLDFDNEVSRYYDIFVLSLIRTKIKILSYCIFKPIYLRSKTRSPQCLIPF